MTSELVVFNNPMPVKPYKLDFVMGYNEDGDPVTYKLKKDNRNYEFVTTNSCGIPRYVISSDDDTLDFLSRIFKDKLFRVPQFGSKEELDGYLCDIPDSLEIEETCAAIEEENPDVTNPDVYGIAASMFKIIKQGAKRSCRFCIIDKDYPNQLVDVVEVEIKDKYNNTVIGSVRKEEYV